MLQLQLWKNRQGFDELLQCSCQVTLIGIGLVGLQQYYYYLQNSMASNTNVVFRWISWSVLIFGVVCFLIVEHTSRLPRNNLLEFQRRWKAYYNNNKKNKEKQQQQLQQQQSSSLSSPTKPPPPPILVCIGDSYMHGSVSANFVNLIRPKLFQILACRLTSSSSSSTSSSLLLSSSSSSLSSSSSSRTNPTIYHVHDDNPLSNPLWVVNVGQNSICSWTVYHERLASVIACQPDWVLIMLGSNDIGALWKPEYSKRYQQLWNLPVPPNWTDYRKHMDGIVQCLLQESLSSPSSSSSSAPIQVGLCTLPPMGEDLEHPVNSQLIRKANEMLHDIAQQHGDRCTLIPVYETLVEELRRRRACAQPHHSHCRPGRPASDKFVLLAICMAPLHYVFGLSWNYLSHLVGNLLLTDSLHFNDDAADIVANLVVQWLIKTNVETRISQQQQQQQQEL